MRNSTQVNIRGIDWSFTNVTIIIDDLIVLHEQASGLCLQTTASPRGEDQPYQVARALMGVDIQTIAIRVENKRVGRKGEQD
jgi:hypothetical protein